MNAQWNQYVFSTFQKGQNEFHPMHCLSQNSRFMWSVPLSTKFNKSIWHRKATQWALLKYIYTTLLIHTIESAAVCILILRQSVLAEIVNSFACKITSFIQTFVIFIHFSDYIMLRMLSIHDIRNKTTNPNVKSLSNETNRGLLYYLPIFVFKISTVTHTHYKMKYNTESVLVYVSLEKSIWFYLCICLA